MDSTLVRVKDHDGRQLLDTGVMTQTESVFIQPGTLEAALETTAGRVLLRLLKAVDYAGAQRRPVMLLGRKQSNGGFMLHLTVPVYAQRKTGPPEVAGKGAPGATRNGKSTQQGEAFYRT